MSDDTTEKLIREWETAQDRLALLKGEVNSAECALRNATTALAKWLTLDDGKDDEKFSIWQGGRLLSVMYNKTKGEATVWVRLAKKAKS